MRSGPGMHRPAASGSRRHGAGDGECGSTVFFETLDKEKHMKVKTNVRAGKSINNTVVSYKPPVSRCVGI